MLNFRKRKLALALSTALAMAGTPASATHINVDTTSVFSNALNDLVNSFTAYYFNTYGLDYEVGFTSTGEAKDLKAGIVGGTDFSDLLLATSPEVPLDLRRHHRNLVTGEPFVYAFDSLSLFSTTMDISAGLPSHLTAPLVIPDPAGDNYGEAATQILASRPWKIPPSSIPNDLVFAHAEFDASTVAFGLEFGSSLGASYGFTGTSQVCRFASSVGFVFAGFHHEYEPFDREHPYEPELVTLTGIKMATRTRTADEEAELNNFITFVLGTKDSFGVANPTGPAILQSYCFKLPHHLNHLADGGHDDHGH